MTIEVKYQADQRRKDSRVLSNETTKSVTEENAIREVSGLIGHFAKGVAAWQARHPNVLAKADAPAPTATSTGAPASTGTAAPSAGPASTPSASPTVIAALPPACQAVTEVATELVPEPTPRARALQDDGDDQSECRWLNLNLAGDGQTKIRSGLITTHRFTNRAGAPDVTKAKSYYAGKLGGAKNLEGSRLGQLSWGRIEPLKGFGEQAYYQYVQVRKGTVFSSSGSVMARAGATVVVVDYAGSQRPEGEPANSPKVVLMGEEEARAGALKLAKAYLAELAAQPAAN